MRLAMLQTIFWQGRKYGRKLGEKKTGEKEGGREEGEDVNGVEKWFERDCLEWGGLREALSATANDYLCAGKGGIIGKNVAEPAEPAEGKRGGTCTRKRFKTKT